MDSRHPPRARRSRSRQVKTGQRLTPPWLSSNTGPVSREHASSATNKTNSATSSNFASAHRARHAKARSSARPSRHSLAHGNAEEDAVARGRRPVLGPRCTRHEGRSRHGSRSAQHLARVEVSPSRDPAFEQRRGGWQPGLARHYGAARAGVGGGIRSRARAGTRLQDRSQGRRPVSCAGYRRRCAQRGGLRARPLCGSGARKAGPNHLQLHEFEREN